MKRVCKRDGYVSRDFSFSFLFFSRELNRWIREMYDILHLFLLFLSLSFEKYFHILGMMDRSKRKIFRYAKEERTHVHHKRFKNI